MNKILVTGAQGQIGQSIKARINNDIWDVLMTAKDVLDITNVEQIATVFTQFKPDVVINTAAYTHVDRAEKEPESAEAVNAYGAYLLAKQCQESGALLVHLSTDYIFDGNAEHNYSEDDLPAPLGVYGSTKWRGEQYIRTYLANYFIIRTSWVFSEYQHNFVASMLKLARNVDEICVVNDQLGCPTYAGDVANLVLDIADDYARDIGRYQCGEYHFCGDDCLSRYDFACAIFTEIDKYSQVIKQRNLRGISSEEYAAKAKRPKNGILNCHKISHLFRPSDWRKALQYVINKSLG